MSVNFHIPDFSRHFRINLMLYDMIKNSPQYFREDIKIGSCYGAFPSMLWNGGRFLQGSADEAFMRQVFKLFNEKGIPIRFTFTNPLVREEHLRDPFCNFALKMGENGMNEVIVMSPVLEDYIRRTYPGYSVISSTCKQIEDMSALEKELEKDYKMVVLDYNWNNRFDILEKIPHKDKCEILVNAVCIPNCPRRGEHYRSIGQDHLRLGKYQKNAAKNKNQPPFETTPFKCEHMLKQLYDTTDSSVHISPDAMFERYVPMGYSNFKLEGRSSPDINLAETYVYYMMKPEMRDRGRLEFLNALTRKISYFK